MATVHSVILDVLPALVFCAGLLVLGVAVVGLMALRRLYGARAGLLTGMGIGAVLWALDVGLSVAASPHGGGGDSILALAGLPFVIGFAGGAGAVAGSLRRRPDAAGDSVSSARS